MSYKIKSCRCAAAGNYSLLASQNLSKGYEYVVGEGAFLRRMRVTKSNCPGISKPNTGIAMAMPINFKYFFENLHNYLHISCRFFPFPFHDVSSISY